MNSKQYKTERPSRKVRRKRLLRVIIAVAVVVLAVRLILPYWLLGYVNKQLSSIKGYYGHVTDIDLALLRGAYVVESIYINRMDSVTKEQTPVFAAPVVDISIEWNSLFKGRIVSEMDFYSPSLRFTENKAELEQMEKDTNDFRQMLRAFTPLKVNRFEIFDGKLGYLDNTVTPVVDVELDNAHVLAKNLSNVLDTALLPASVIADADVYGGKLDFNMRIDALADHPTYDMNAEIKNANLVQLNDFFKAYADFDINKGSLGVALELAAKDRKFIGYIKPVIEDLDVVGPEDRKDSFFKKIWEGIVGVAGDVLENKDDQIATKIPIAGEFGDTTVGVWYAVLTALRNGLIHAIYPSLDNQVTIGSVQAIELEKNKKQGFFKEIFGKPGVKEQKDSKN